MRTLVRLLIESVEDVLSGPGFCETIVSTTVDGRPYATPIGASPRGRDIVAFRCFRGSTLYRVLAPGHEIVFNVCSDPRKFVDALLHRDRLAFVPGARVSAPRVDGCEAYVEAVIESFRDLGEARWFQARALLIEVRAPPRAYRRVLGLVIEALIELTRLGIEGVESRVELIREMCRRIEHLGEESLARSILEALSRRLSS